MSLVVDRDAITKYVTSDSVTKELTVPKVTREVYITPKDEGGVEIGADKTLGVDGIEVTGAGDAPNVWLPPSSRTSPLIPLWL